MQNPLKAPGVAAVIFLVFGFLAWQLPKMLGTTGASTWILRIGLFVLGLAASVLVFLYLRAKDKAAKESGATADSDDIDHAIHAAESRLAAAKLTSDSKIARLPIALVLGPMGSTKSSIVMHSGLDPELLSGEVMRGETVIPTDPLNIWYAHGTILAEAGGRLFDDAERWAKFVKHLQPSRLAAAIGRGKQAPRIAILCIGCDEFTKPGASAQLAASARTIRARLGEISQQLGIRLPVYVLFTRADRLQFFAEYVRSFTTQESQQVLGATLTIAGDTGGAWAERESHRLNEAFGRIVHSLSLRRLDLLPRENQEDVRASSYEFPRELHKIVEPAVQFLIDVFRPSQLGVNPLLRGFYFTGVRPIIMRDAVSDLGAHARGGAPGEGATAVFNPAALQQAAVQADPRGGGRKVPQWVFLQRLFQDVVLRDDVAARITGGGARLDFLRRGLITAAAAACVILAIGFTVSWAKNRSLIRAATAAVTQARDVGNAPGRTVDEDITKLDVLREQTARVTEWEHKGRPLGYRWGLYTGNNVQPLLAKVYFAGFNRILWSGTQQKLLQYMRELPAAPDENSDFGKAQDALAAHLITTTDNQRSTVEALTPTLTTFWGGADASDSTKVRAERQFTFFAEVLPFGNPYSSARDDELVKRTQNFLRLFGPQAYYRVLVAAASGNAAARRYEGPAAYLRNGYTVQGAFTIPGYAQVQAKMDSVDILFARYEWIYGAPPEKPKRAELQRLYENDYVMNWQRYLESANVSAFSTPLDAASTLRALAQASSPLVNMLLIASRETHMDSASRIGKAFQPLRVTVPPEDPKGPAVNLQEYLNQLGTLESRLTLLGSAPQDAQAAGVAMAAEAANEVKMKVSAISAGYVTVGDAGTTARALQRLLLQPGEFAMTHLTRRPADALTAAARSFCEAFSPLQGRYPFDPDSKEDASSRVVTGIFKKGDGALWSFHERMLKQYFNAQGTRILPGAEGVSQAFANFFSGAADFSNALYTANGGPVISFYFRPFNYAGATEVILEVGGQPSSFSPSNASAKPITWRPDAGRPARLTLRNGARQLLQVDGPGEWSIFRLIRSGTWREVNDKVMVEWAIPNQSEPFVAEVILEVKPVLRPGYLKSVASCPTRVLNQ